MIILYIVLAVIWLLCGFKSWKFFIIVFSDGKVMPADLFFAIPMICLWPIVLMLALEERGQKPLFKFKNKEE